LCENPIILQKYLSYNITFYDRNGNALSMTLFF